MVSPPDKNPLDPSREHTKTLTYLHCSKHGQAFRPGQRCLKCEAEEREQAKRGAS